MQDNNSFLYPQGFHIGALYYIVKRLGEKDYSFPLNPQTYSPRDYDLGLDTFQRECRYRIWALMEMGMIEDHRETSSHLSYQKLTEIGQSIYELMKEVTFPQYFFTRKGSNSWAMSLQPMEYIQFTKGLEEDCFDLFNILYSCISIMDASRDFVSHFLLSNRFTIPKNELYGTYFSNPIVRDTFVRRGLIPPKDSYETARRRISVLIGLLESVNIVEGYSIRTKGNVRLLNIPESISDHRVSQIESKVEESIDELNVEEVETRLTELEENLSILPPRKSTPQTKGDIVHYPRYPALAKLLKRKFNYTCQVCGAIGFKKQNDTLFISHHHMIPMSKGIEYGSNPDTPSNILIVCSWCHDKLEYGKKELKCEIYNELKRKGTIDQKKVDELSSFNII